MHLAAILPEFPPVYQVLTLYTFKTVVHRFCLRSRRKAGAVAHHRFCWLLKQRRDGTYRYGGVLVAYPSNSGLLLLYTVV